MQTLVDALAAGMEGVRIWRETAVITIEKTVSGYRLTVASKKLPVEAVDVAAVIVTTPAYVGSNLLAGIDEELSTLLAQIPYASTALVNLAFEEAEVPELDGYGYVIPQVEGRDALACTWSSRKWQNRAPAGKVLLRVYIGRYGQADVTQYTDEHLLAIAQTEIGETLGIEAAPLFRRIIRYSQAMPQYNLGHLELLAEIEERLTRQPGLFLAGAAFNGVGIPDCIASGEKAAQAAATFLYQEGNDER
jgi:oxygen-dependent protoporphyrinogen oxidase